ncbi:hypothetical protein [Candidatus Harpocratesius sp.]
MNTKQLYKISKYSYDEAFLESTLNMAGANQQQILERLKKNSKYLRNQRLTSKIVMAIYLALFIFVPIQSLGMIKSALSQNTPIPQILLAGSGMIGVFLFLQVFYLLMFGLFSSTGLFTPESYRWLSTLPIERKKMPIIGLFTLFRGMNIQIVIMTLVFPISILIITMNPLLTTIALIESFLVTIFSVALLVIFGAKFTRLINSNVGNNKGATLIRIGVIFGYILGTIMASVGIQMVNPIMIKFLATMPLPIDQLLILNKWLSLIPFPLNAGYLITMGVIGFSTFSTEVLLFAFGGILIFLVVDYRLAKHALNIFYQSIKLEQGVKNTGKISTIDDIKVKSTNQMKAFFLKDAQNITRDIQSLMFVLMPIILPLIAFMASGTSFENNGGESGTDVLYVLTIFYMFMGAFMLIIGVIDIEKSGSTVLASLPIKIREQAKAKILWALIIIPIANLLPTIFFIGKPIYGEIISEFIIIIPMGIVFAVFIMELKVFFFGKMKFKFVLDEVHIERKVGKIIIIIIIGLIVAISYMILVGYLLTKTSLGYAAIILVAIEIVLGIGVYLIFNKMFPKKK